MTYKLGYLGLFLMLWLAPLFWTGWTLRSWPIFPHWLAVEHQVSGLFLKELKSCHDFHLEWKSGDNEWFELNERRLYPYVVFADRSRFDQLVSRSARASLKPQILFKIASHALQHGRAKNMLPEDVTRVRLVRTEWKVGQPELAYPQGAWKRPNSLEVPAIQRAILAEYEIKAQTLTPVKVSREPAVLQAPPSRKPPRIPTAIIPTSPPPTRRLVTPQTPTSPSQIPGSSASTNALPIKTAD